MRPTGADSDPTEGWPLRQAIDAHNAGNLLRLHVPGHQGGAGAPPLLRRRWGRQLWLDDLTEVPGLDDLNAPSGAIEASQAMAAAALGAARAYYLVQGTTGGLVALLLAAARRHPARRAVILPRHSHRALIGAAVVAGLEPVFCRPSDAMHGGATFGMDLLHLAELLREYGREALAVCDTYPTAAGEGGDLGAIATLAHKHGLPLLVDGAHAGLWGLVPGMPPSPLALGADAAVVSAHKSLGSLGQSSLLLTRDSTVAPRAADIGAALRLVTTTSPSYPLLLSLESAVAYWTSPEGKTRLVNATAVALWLRRQLASMGVLLLGGDLQAGPPHWDPLRLRIDAWPLGHSGTGLAARLREQGSVQVESADWRSVLVVIGSGTTRAPLRRLLRALRLILGPTGDDRCGQPPEVVSAVALDSLARAAAKAPPVRCLSPREAWLSPGTVAVRLDEAAGHIAAEALSPYPPGIAVVWPGEQISPEIVELLQAVLAADGSIHGLASPAVGEDEPRVLVVGGR